MALTFLLDEHLRGSALWHAIRQHNAVGVDAIDMVRVGDPPDLPLGTLDPDILLWMEQHGRLLVSLDKRTLPAALAAHLQAGHHCPGIFLIRPGATVPAVLSSLIVHAQ